MFGLEGKYGITFEALPQEPFLISKPTLLLVFFWSCLPSFESDIWTWCRTCSDAGLTVLKCILNSSWMYFLKDLNSVKTCWPTKKELTILDTELWKWQRNSQLPCSCRVTLKLLLISSNSWKSSQICDFDASFITWVTSFLAFLLAFLPPRRKDTLHPSLSCSGGDWGPDSSWQVPELWASLLTKRWRRRLRKPWVVETPWCGWHSWMWACV